QPPDPCLPRAFAGAWARTNGRGDRRGDVEGPGGPGHAGEGARDHQGLAGAGFIGDADRRGRGFAPGRLHRGPWGVGTSRGRVAPTTEGAGGGGPGLADGSRAAGPSAAVRAGGRSRPDAGGGRQGVQRHARADPPDRGEGAAQAAPPVAVEEAQGLPGVTGAARGRRPAPHAATVASNGTTASCRVTRPAFVPFRATNRGAFARCPRLVASNGTTATCRLSRTALVPFRATGGRRS